MGKKVDRSLLTPEQLAERRAYDNRKARESEDWAMGILTA